MKCPECGNELAVTIHPDHSNNDESIEIRAMCPALECEHKSYYTFVNIDDFIEDESE